MALSFGESLKAAQAESEAAAVSATTSVMADEPSVMSLDDSDYGIATLSYGGDGGETWQWDSKYERYAGEDGVAFSFGYDDSNVSSINDSKNVTLNPKQMNINQEHKSQFIPFEMPRYYDGYDLLNATICINYRRSDGDVRTKKAVNVRYSKDKIQFGWLVEAHATEVVGKLEFEIVAFGSDYIWKSRMVNSMNVLESIPFSGELVSISSDETWISEIVKAVAEEIVGMEFNDQLNAANAAAEKAETAATKAEQAADDASAAAEDKVNEVLGDYAKKSYVDAAVDAIDVTDQLADYATNDSVNTLIGNYYTKSETEAKINASLENYATKDDVSDAISSADLDSYYKKDETYSQAEIDEKLGNVSVDLTGYATETWVSNQIAPLSSGVETNVSSIESLSTTVGALQEAVGSIDTSPRLTYDVAYNDADDADVGENVFVFYEIENEGEENEIKSAKKKFTIVGGGGGGGTSSTLKIGYVTTSPLIVTTNDKAVITYNFSGTDSSGDIVPEGVATWKVGGKLVATNTAVAGDNSFDITDYISIGTQKVLLTITDDAGSLATKTWTVQQIDVKLESDFNDTITYPIGEVSFSYKPYGSIDKTVHFKLDGVELASVSTKSSGIPMSYTLPSQSHGSHLVEAYITAELNGNTIESNHIYKDVIWYDSSSSVPVIGCTQQNITAKQYDSMNIVYTVYDPDTETPTVALAVDGETVSTLKLDTPTNTWQYKSSDVGDHVLTITCGETVKTINVTVEKLDIDVNPVTAGLAFDFNPTGYSNNDADRLWSNGDIAMTVSDNFDWTNGGYQIDENGDQYFCVKSGTTATINYNLFSDDPKRNGKEFKLIFKTTNVKNRAASFLSCMNNNIGLDMLIESANIYSNVGSLYSPYCEDDIIEFEFNINKDTDIPMVLTYEDGVANRPMIYTSDSFIQDDPKPITIGCDDCDVHVYRMKAYTNSLSDSDILSNFIADARSAEEMISRYNRNQVYDENGALTPETLAEKCPDLRIIKLEAPWLTNDKKDKVSDTTIEMIYKNGDPVLDNWICTGAKHSGQGTSSNEYGYAGRNLDLIMDGSDALFTFGDGETTGKTITLTRDSTPTDYLNFKCNIASSENQNNAQMTMRFNEYQPYIRPARLVDEKVRDTMEFYNCVVFVKESDGELTGDNSNHREFTNWSYHYYALGNVGDSKKTDDTRVFDADDPKEHCIEVMDYNVPLAEFPTGYTDDKGEEAICPESEWAEGNTAYDYLHVVEYDEDGLVSSFGDGSYEFRYETKGITLKQQEANMESWRDAYKFVVTSDDDTFISDFDKYFVKDSILYFYLFTERYSLLDNRAKNLFYHYGKAWYSEEEAAAFKEEFNAEIPTEYIDNAQASFNGGYRYDLTWGYDFDTCLGISNTGKLEVDYGKEDVDYYNDDPAQGLIFRAGLSNFFQRVRNLFSLELQNMFVDRESANAWSAEGLISQWDNAQSQFPEEIWRLDIQRKYLRTYQGISIDSSIAGTANTRFLIEMLNGRKKYQRRMFERNQELYFATKYFGNTATADQIMMRFNNPEGDVAVKPNFTLYITPYSDMYIGVKFGNFTATNFRAKAGVEYTVPYNYDTADITLIYGASFIQAIGDLSKCYVGDNDFSKASRLQSLVVGSDIEGYANPKMTQINVGNNKLLEYLDVKNVTGLSSVIDLSQCGNLLELHAEGSCATGVIFANGGKIKRAYLPAIISLTAKNLNYLEEFDVDSYENLQSLIVENTPFFNTYDMVNTAAALKTVRLIGMDWNEDYLISDSSVLDRMLTMRGVGNDGYETLVSVLTGAFHASVVRQQQLKTYNETWKDLDVTYSTLIEQYPVTFVNYDGTVLDVQYVDKGSYAVDPIEREDNPIAVPTKDSTVSTDYTFSGWDTNFETIQIFSAKTVTALFDESIREYTIKYVSKGTTLQTSSGKYGSNVVYTGDTPTYTLEESGYKYYLFDRWDKSGFIDGDKTVNAVFDTFEYKSGVFNGKQLSDLSPVEVYALTKMTEPIDKEMSDFDMVVEAGDAFSFTMGYDIDYDDIESVELISENTVFDGTNYVDTGIKLFDEDKDFVLALDYKLLTGNDAGDTLMQCFQTSGSNGFKLSYNSGVSLAWGSSSTVTASVGDREMLVIRHIKGDNNLYVYMSNMESTSYGTKTIEKTTATQSDSATLVFGAAKMDSGRFANYGSGEINWAKVWYRDLGDDVCKQLVGWTHESISLEVDGFYRYALYDDPSKESMMSLLATHLLETPMKWNTSNNSGGWAKSSLNSFLNSRFYDAIPYQIKALMKKVAVSSTIGDKSTELSESGCYVNVPSLYDLDKSQTAYASEVYDTNGSISYMTGNAARKRAYPNGDYAQYWTRSPNMQYLYVWSIDSAGATYGFNTAGGEYGVLIELSF